MLVLHEKDCKKEKSVFFSLDEVENRRARANASLVDFLVVFFLQLINKDLQILKTFIKRVKKRGEKSCEKEVKSDFCFAKLKKKLQQCKKKVAINLNFAPKT